MSGRLDRLGRLVMGEASARRGARLLALFLILRLGLVGVTLARPEGGILVDSRGYLALRNRIVNTGRYSSPEGSAQDLNWPPGYPAFLGLVRTAFGASLWPVAALQLAMSGALSLAVLRFGERAMGTGAGLVGAWALALSPNAVVWSLTVMSEVLFTGLLVLAAAVLLAGEPGSLKGRALASGALLGLSAYVRPIALMLLPAWLICLALMAWRRGSRRRALLASVAFLLAGSALTAPWFLRNYRVHGRATFSTVGEKTLVGFNLSEVLADAKGISRNQAVSEIDEDQGALQLTIGLLRQYPVSFLKTQSFGVVRTALGADIGAWGNVLGWDDWTGLGLMSGLFGREGAPGQLRQASSWETGLRYSLLVVSILHTCVFLGLAAVGVLRWPVERSRLDYWLPLVTVGLMLLAPGASGQARFRVPVEPFLALFAGVGGLALLTAFRSRREEPYRPQAAGAQDRMG